MSHKLSNNFGLWQWYVKLFKKDKLQLFLQRSYVAITYIKVIIYNGNAGLTSYQHSEHTSYRLSHKQFNNSMNYETDSIKLKKDKLQ